MFKRVERRIRKKEKEEELGLDEGTKEMLGLNAADTDSDESDSSSASEGDSNNEDQEADLGEDEDASDAEEDIMGENEEDEEESEVGSGEEAGDEEDEPPISVSEALKNPLWHVSLEPEVKACAVCPGKLLKNTVMIGVHIKSGAHKRRFTKLREAAMNVDPETDVRDLVRAQRLASQPQKAAEGRLSKRAEKKKAKLAAIKAKCAKQKVMKAKYRAKQEAKEKTITENEAVIFEPEDGADPSPAKPPATKKRRVDRDVEDEDKVSKAATPHAKKQKPSMGKTDAKALRALPASTKASKPPKKFTADAPSNRSEISTVKSKQKSITKPTTSPLKTAVLKDSKVMKKRKRPDAVS